MQARVAFFCSTFACAAFGAAQGEAPVEVGATLEIHSKYIWHGLNLVNGWVFQPELLLSRGDFSLSLWGSMELSNWNSPNYMRDPALRFTEVDLSLEYEKDFESSGWYLGLVDYQYPGTGWERYREWYLGGYSDFDWGSSWATAYTGDSGTGTYLTAGLSRSSGDLDVAAEVTFGDATSNEFTYGTRKAGVTDIHLWASKDFELSDGRTFTPALHFASLLDSDLMSGEPRRSNFWVSFSYSFKF